MCKCYLSQICFCILIFCKELGLCCMTNLNSNSGSAFSLLRDLDPNITSLWASVSLTLCLLSISICLCLSLSIYLCLHICMNIYIYIYSYVYMYKNKGCYFSFNSSQMGPMYMNYTYMTEHYIINRLCCYTECSFSTLLFKMWPKDQGCILVKCLLVWDEVRSLCQNVNQLCQLAHFLFQIKSCAPPSPLSSQQDFLDEGNSILIHVVIPSPHWLVLWVAWIQSTLGVHFVN